MASLKNIMNTDDDQIDPRSIQRPHESAPRSSQHPDSSTSNSRYATSSDPSTTPSTHSSLPGPSSHPSRSLVPEASSSSSSSRPISGRRRSSTDSMDSPYGTSQSSSTMRPYGPGRSSGEPHVKLTPITKRISKAKKGVPVHICDQCLPPKTFTRAEHLRRHQLSHQPPDLPCPVPGCDKVFHRKDLLERHQQRHEQDDASGREGSQSSSGRRNSKNSGQPYGNPSRESVLQMPPGFRGSGSSVSPDPSSNSVMAAGSWNSLSNAPSAPQNHMSSAHIPDASEDYNMGGDKDYVLGQPITGIPPPADSYTPSFSEPRAMSSLYIPDAGPGSLWADSSGMPSSASESTYSTPSNDTRRIPMRTSSGEWNNTQLSIVDTNGYTQPYPTYSSASPPQLYQTFGATGLGIPYPGYEDTSLYDPNPIIPTTTVRSLSPQMAVAQRSETLVTVPSALHSDRVMNSACGRQPLEMFNFHAARDTVPVPLTRATREHIPRYLEVYWAKVHPQLPILHKATFGDASGVAKEHLDVLQCAMAAVATQFAETKDDRVRGEQLHAYARYKSKLFTQSDEWPVPLQQTVALCDYYARFRGKRKESYRPSSRFGPLYQRALNNVQNAFTPATNSRDVAQQWKSWIELESRRRILSACFLLDVHSARYHEQPYTLIAGLDYSSPRTLPIPLTASTAQFWDAPSFEAWSMLRPKRNLKALNNTQVEALTPSDIASAPPFDAAILLAAYALHIDQRQNPMIVNLVEDARTIQPRNMHMATLFSGSAIANTYLALHYTPLHFLLSVSGDSWVFNKKVMPVSSFTEHQKRLNQWRQSGSAAAATIFAARALKTFFNLTPESLTSAEDADSGELSTSWTDISDYWGVYVCVLICWAFGHAGKRDKAAELPPRDASIQWIMTVAEMEPDEVQNWPGRFEAHGVVGLVRKELAKDCLGGRNILFADAVGVLEKLEQGGNWKWF
ncbi:Fc.00g102170.m01.CDS01 [Cosmosporella sp. VM-42]